jgi:putative glutathione S-transferase
MGQLVDGVWHKGWIDTKKTGGKFVRQDAAFRSAIGDDGFEPEAGRYHLYVSMACPWAHRVLIMRELKGLQDVISVSKVDALMLENGWTLPEDEDPIHGARFMHEVYTAAKADYTGRVTVPVLWDRKNGTIVNNESAELLRMLDGWHGDPEYRPDDLADEIDRVNERVYQYVNNGVYKCGFATSQEAYEDAYEKLFSALDWLEERLSKQRYVAGDRITEADWRLFTTLLRFDPVYHGHFKCNARKISEYPNLQNYLLDLYQRRGIAGTVDFDTIKKHYYGSHDTVNPTGIVPAGPVIDLDRPHDRGRFDN